jgi:hypothetical protein
MMTLSASGNRRRLVGLALLSAVAVTNDTLAKRKTKKHKGHQGQTMASPVKACLSAA